MHRFPRMLYYSGLELVEPRFHRAMRRHSVFR